MKNFHRIERKLTAYMIDDCLNDPVLAAKVILGYTVQPHLELRLWGMWTKSFMVDSSGYGMGKSLGIALVSGLRAVLMSERVGGITSKTFAQGQEVHRYFDEWIEKSALFRSQIKFERGAPVNLSSSSSRELQCLNESRVRTIVPDFKGKAERAGSEDWHDGYYDEWTKYPDILSFERQLLTRARKPILNYDGSNPIFANHTYMCGTAKYQWHPCFARVQRFQGKMLAGSPEHEVQSWNYTHVPERYHRYMRMPLIKELEEGMPRDLAQQEIMGIWTRDSLGFYNMSDIEGARSGSCVVELERSE